MSVSPVPTISTVRILCIDDDKALLQCEKALLESFGYSVMTAPSGREGLELAKCRGFDVVIVDYYMPKMNGHEFATAMRRFSPGVPIIMFSGDLNVPKEALEVVDAFVTKDSLTSNLLSAITLLSKETSAAA